MNRDAVIISAARTPVGKCRGSMASIPAHELGAIAAKEAVNRANIDPAEIDDIVFGNLFNTEVANMARWVGLTAGFPQEVPGVTLDRQCASSLNTIAYAAAMIEAGYEEVLLAGGVESDSRRNYILPKAELAYQVTPPQILISGPCAPGELGIGMGFTAENVAEKYGLNRLELDEFSLWSHQKAANAWESGYFDEQVVPVQVRKKKSMETVAKDEIVRADATLESLGALPPAFLEDGVVTAGNSSPMSDGAGAVVVMSRARAEAAGARRMFRFAGFAVAGVDPRIMGIGPIAAVGKLFRRKGLTWDDVDLIELNEAFAAQSVACVRELDIPMEKLNVNGGAIALGHPLAGTGAILTTKMIYELERRDLTTGVITFCIGGGQGAAAFIERIR